MSVKSWFLTRLGDIKLLHMTRWPHWVYWMYYQPGDYYAVSGADTRLAQLAIRPGDLVLRGYASYLDGCFIPGDYTHTGVYVGGGKVIHAVAEGVIRCDLIDFLRCDRAVILRPYSGQKEALKRVEKWIGKPYDFEFSAGYDAFYCHELAAEAYWELRIPRLKAAWWRKKKYYLAESFLNHPAFRRVLILDPLKEEKE